MAPILSRISNVGGGGNGGFNIKKRFKIRGILFPFSTFTFTPGPATLNVGPTLNQLLSSYNTTQNPWLTDPSFFSVPINGYQRMVIPTTGIYDITCAGAVGAFSPVAPAAAGSGGIITARFTFNQGDELYFVVGQTGQNDTGDGNNPRLSGFNGGGGAQYNAGGGGGASDVRLNGTDLSNRIIVGGGGGGGGHSGVGGAGGYPAGTNGSGGTGGTSTSGFSLGTGQTGSGTCVSGGGGGYWGGTTVPGSHGSSGGGGSSFVDLNKGSLVSHTTGGNNSTGYITMTFIS